MKVKGTYKCTCRKGYYYRGEGCKECKHPKYYDEEKNNCRNNRCDLTSEPSTKTVANGQTINFRCEGGVLDMKEVNMAIAKQLNKFQYYGKGEGRLWTAIITVHSSREGDGSVSTKTCL